MTHITIPLKKPTRAINNIAMMRLTDMADRVTRERLINIIEQGAHNIPKSIPNMNAVNQKGYFLKTSPLF